MAHIIDTRKRSREEDPSCDFMPLSKRINNLHINNATSGLYIEQTTIPVALPPPNLSNYEQYDNYHHHHHHQEQQQQQHYHLPDGVMHGPTHINSSIVINQNNMPKMYTDENNNNNNNTNTNTNTNNITNNHNNNNNNNNNCNNNNSNNNNYIQNYCNHNNYQQQQQQQQHHSNECIYEPDLNQDENPFYYDTNKLLFYLHFERLRRSPN